MTEDQKKEAERRREPRVNSTLAVIYQRISPREIEADPYDARFDLPQHFTMRDELAQIDSAQRAHIQALAEEDPRIGSLFQSIHLKIDIIAQAINDSLGRMLSPLPQRVNLSASGLSFHASEPVTPGSYIHLAISSPANSYNVAAIGRVVFCEDEDLEGFRTGVAFVNLRHLDRQTLSRDVEQKAREVEVFDEFKDPDNI